MRVLPAVTRRFAAPSPGGASTYVTHHRGQLEIGGNPPASQIRNPKSHIGLPEPRAVLIELDDPAEFLIFPIIAPILREKKRRRS
jgi:hypothetical protein